MNTAKYKTIGAQILLFAIIAIEVIYLYSTLKEAHEEYHRKEKNNQIFIINQQVQ